MICVEHTHTHTHTHTLSPLIRQKLHPAHTHLSILRQPWLTTEINSAHLRMLNFHGSQGGSVDTGVRGMYRENNTNYRPSSYNFIVVKKCQLCYVYKCCLQQFWVKINFAQSSSLTCRRFGKYQRASKPRMLQQTLPYATMRGWYTARIQWRRHFHFAVGWGSTTQHKRLHACEYIM